MSTETIFFVLYFIVALIVYYSSVYWYPRRFENYRYPPIELISLFWIFSVPMSILWLMYKARKWLIGFREGKQ